MFPSVPGSSNSGAGCPVVKLIRGFYPQGKKVREVALMGDSRATYGGPGWAPRESRLDEEIRAGELWAPLASDTGHERLTDVLLYRPGPTIGEVEDVDRALHLRRVDATRLHDQVDHLIETYTSLGIRVHLLSGDCVDDSRHPNSIFLCDVFWQTPFGAVISRMANPVRAGEERAVAARLAELGVPLALTMATAYGVATPAQRRSTAAELKPVP